MSRIVWVFLMATLVALTAPRGLAAPRKAEAGPHPVRVIDQTWTDPARGRAIPVRIYLPADATTRSAVIVFSHGLGGSREGYSYLGRHWASWGYVSVHPQHPGSDTSILTGEGAEPEPAARAGGLRGRIAGRIAQRRLERRAGEAGAALPEGAAAGIVGRLREAMSPEAAVDRLLDIQFVVARLKALDAATSGPLAGRLDMTRLGMAGHSFGAWTTLGVLGLRLGPGGRRVVVPDFRAGIAMSSPVAPKALVATAYKDIRTPILHMTGTLDDPPVNDTKAAERRVPFDHIDGAPQWLVTFDGADHMTFSGRVALRAGRRQSAAAARDPEFHKLILEATTAFWDAYLNGDAEAKEWLSGGGFAAEMGGEGKLEQKAGEK